MVLNIHTLLVKATIFLAVLSCCYNKTCIGSHALPIAIHHADLGRSAVSTSSEQNLQPRLDINRGNNTYHPLDNSFNTTKNTSNERSNRDNMTISTNTTAFISQNPNTLPHTNKEYITMEQNNNTSPFIPQDSIPMQDIKKDNTTSEKHNVKSMVSKYSSTMNTPSRPLVNGTLEPISHGVDEISVALDGVQFPGSSSTLSQSLLRRYFQTDENRYSYRSEVDTVMAQSIKNTPDQPSDALVAGLRNGTTEMPVLHRFARSISGSVRTISHGCCLTNQYTVRYERLRDQHNHWRRLAVINGIQQQFLHETCEQVEPCPRCVNCTCMLQYSFQTALYEDDHDDVPKLAVFRVPSICRCINQ